MKHIGLFVVAGVLCLAATGQTHAVVRDNGLKIEAERIRRADTLLEVGFSVDYAALRISTNEQLALYPVLIGDRDTLYLPYLSLAGKNRDKVNRRRAALYGTDRENENIPLWRAVRLERDRRPGTIRYTTSVPFQEWMSGARLELMQVLSGCADCQQKLPALLIGSVEKDPVQFAPQVAFLEPDVETVKMRKESGDAFLNFLQGQSVILPHYDRNASELEKINRTIQAVTDDPDVTCQGIELKGFASPEGSYAFNTRLSEARAEALAKYIRQRYPRLSCPVTAESGSEDWAGLRRWLLSSGTNYRQAVLDIIDRVDDPDARDSEIRRLEGGRVYDRLLKEAYPSLRKVNYVIHYSVVPFTVEEGKRLLKANPGRLSLNEMYLIAATYPKGSKAFNEVFLIAVRQFPEDAAANNNAAAVALLKGDKETARRHLMRVRDIPAAQNNLGVLYILEGDLPAAEACFRKARAAGNREAADNLSKMNPGGL